MIDRNASPQGATLRLDLNHAYMPVVLEFTEGCARAFGLSEEDAARVRLACEETFGYLCQGGRPDSDVTIEARNCIYRMEITFAFKARSFDPYALNLTAKVTPEEGQMDNIGLLIASRSVDRLSICHDQPDGLSLVLTKEKSYPPWCALELDEVAPLNDFIIKTPDREMVKRLARNGIAYYEDFRFPSFFRSPARMVDMMARGDYCGLVATGTGTFGGEVGGAIIWRFLGKAMVEFYGPYVFGQPNSKEVARSLTDGFLQAIAKTDASGTFCRYTTDDIPAQYFELLGSVRYSLGQNTEHFNTFHYRQLKEDEGSHVWADPQLIPFLKDAYGRLFLPRKIMTATFEGEMRGYHSVISVEFDRPRESVIMRSVWDGADGAENIAGHLSIFQGENLPNIFFELDLGSAWQARLAPALFQNGFRPVLLVPYAGQADMVVFQHDR